jgi:1,4-dihydroxy-2-naphthoyl-CoA hydrolase
MPTHTRDITVRLKDTDAAGVLYFASLLVFAHETFEAFLDARGLPLGRLLAGADYALPVVHCEADYRRRVGVGDLLTVEMTVGEAGESSFALEYALRRDGEAVGTCRIVHASVDRETFRSVSLPDEVRDQLAGS